MNSENFPIMEGPETSNPVIRAKFQPEGRSLIKILQNARDSAVVIFLVSSGDYIIKEVLGREVTVFCEAKSFSLTKAELIRQVKEEKKTFDLSNIIQVIDNGANYCIR